jgi:antitoxin component YwqK of YwqJK toxin-antitoxin module
MIYKNNLLNGKCYSYDETGKPIKEAEYKDGELVK